MYGEEVTVEDITTGVQLTAFSVYFHMDDWEEKLCDALRKMVRKASWVKLVREALELYCEVDQVIGRKYVMENWEEVSDEKLAYFPRNFVQSVLCSYEIYYRSEIEIAMYLEQ